MGNYLKREFRQEMMNWEILERNYCGTDGKFYLLMDVNWGGKVCLDFCTLW